ncbi:MAG: hypothetical protein IKJ52_11875 [Muribaculaceae bacterium]|nr:hypothetical protein [Muribaculaceae bacterium]
MKKSLLLLVVAIFTLTTAFEASAKWTDRNTFGLKGPVKAVYENDYEYPSLEFDEDGDIIYEEVPDIYWAHIDRDNKGRIIYMEKLGFAYNTKGQVKETCGSGGGATFQTKYTYNTKGQVIKEVNSGEGPDGRHRTSTTTYTYQKFDKYGNWTKRTAKTGRKSTVETRTITYY